MKSISDISKIFKTRVEKIVVALGLHAFLAILLLVFMACMLGGVVFYNYVYLAERGAPSAADTIIKFNYKAYQSVIDSMGQGREGAQ